MIHPRHAPAPKPHSPSVQDARSHATLQPPAYAASGRWAVSVWAKLTPGALAQGRRWSYLLGQADEGGWSKGEGPNKVRLGRGRELRAG